VPLPFIELRLSAATRAVRFLAAAAVGLAVLAGVTAAQAGAVILSPTTIAGPSTEGLSLGGVAMAPDGTGGLVYTETVEGVQHVFASRYDGSQWSSPMRVDGAIPLAASQPRIAASKNGRLLVVWVAPVATLAKGGIRYGLYSAALGAGAGEFGAPLLVDGNVGEGIGVDPSVAGTTPGNAIVAYRVVTDTFPPNPSKPDPNVQLRPGDVMAEIRAARLEGGRWSKIPALNRNAAASMRAPTEVNAPQVAIGATGRAVVAWQEPDLSGAARILMRRITGTTPGPAFLASPETWNGRPITEDATAFSLGVTSLDQARVVATVEGGPGSPLGGSRVFLTTLGSSTTPAGAKPVGPEPVDGPGAPLPGPLGPPSAAASTGKGSEGSMQLAFASGSTVRRVGINEQGKVLEPETVPGPSAIPGTPALSAVGPEGGGVVAYEASAEGGLSAVAVYQAFATGGSQNGILFGPIGGAVTQLMGSESGVGDALLAFRQGENGQFAIVADRVAAAPGNFSLHVPERWVAPRQATVSWGSPPSGVGSLSYGVLLNGRMVGSGLQGHQYTPPPSKLFSGVAKVQVIATDHLGEEALSQPAKLRVDSQPPRLQLHLRARRGIVRIKLVDAQSGLKRGATKIAFGDGTSKRGRAKLTHRYTRAGTYQIRLRAEDKVGNALVQRIRVKVE
jgi:hypothetical protein